MRLVHPPKLVLVRRDDRWHPGQLRAWRRDGVGWLGFVCYTVAVGARHLEWVDADRVREAQGLGPGGLWFGQIRSVLPGQVHAVVR